MLPVIRQRRVAMHDVNSAAYTLVRSPRYAGTYSTLFLCVDADVGGPMVCYNKTSHSTARLVLTFDRTDGHVEKEGLRSRRACAVVEAGWSGGVVAMLPLGLVDTRLAAI